MYLFDFNNTRLILISSYQYTYTIGDIEKYYARLTVYKKIGLMSKTIVSVYLTTNETKLI